MSKIWPGRWRGTGAITIALALTVGGIALAQTLRSVWSSKPEVRVLEGKSSRSTTLVVLPKGVAMQVLAEEGPWLKVQTVDKDGKPITGYVFKGNTSDEKVDGGDLAAAFGMGGGQTSGMETSLAGKGVAEEVASMSKGRSWDVAMADRMIAVSRSVTAAQLEAFDREGNVGISAK